MIGEVRAYQSYSRRRWELSYWRTLDGQEGYLIIDDHIAMEIKATSTVNLRDLRGFTQIQNEADWKKKNPCESRPPESGFGGSDSPLLANYFRKTLGASRLAAIAAEQAQKAPPKTRLALDTLCSCRYFPALLQTQNTPDSKRHTL